MDGAPSILTHAPVGCGRLCPMNRLFYGDNLTVLREAVASESAPAAQHPNVTHKAAPTTKVGATSPLDFDQPF